MVDLVTFEEDLTRAYHLPEYKASTTEKQSFSSMEWKDSKHRYADKTDISKNSLPQVNGKQLGELVWWLGGTFVIASVQSSVYFVLENNRKKLINKAKNKGNEQRQTKKGNETREVIYTWPFNNTFS